MPRHLASKAVLAFQSFPDGYYYLTLALLSHSKLCTLGFRIMCLTGDNEVKGLDCIEEEEDAPEDQEN